MFKVLSYETKYVKYSKKLSLLLKKLNSQKIVCWLSY